MASSILNSDDGVISGTSGLKSTGGDDGVLVFQSKGTETARINTDSQIVAAAGTASLPIYSTTGDLNTGIYFPAADTIGFVEGGAEAMRIDSSGNVGIGITSPNATLQVLRAASTGEYLRVGANSAAQDRSLRFSTFTVGGSVDVGHLIDAPGTSSVNGTIAFATNNTERMRIDSSGNVGIGTSSPDEELDVNGNVAIGSTSDAFSEIRFFNSTATSGTTRIRGNANDILFFTGNAERARIDSSGNLLVGTTSTAPGVGTTDSGIALRGVAGVAISRGGATPLSVARNTNDGALVGFYQAGTLEGEISVSGSTVTYGGGHLARWGQLLDGSKDESLKKGTVLSNLDEMCVWSAPTTYWTEEDELPVDEEGNPTVAVGDVKQEAFTADNEQCNKIKVSDVEGDANVAGVFVSWTYDEQFNSNDLFVAMTGDMIIRIAQGVTVARGDLLMSAGDGTAMPQGDDIVRSKTVAKVTSTHVTCTYADGSYCVPCVLMAC